jgi:hypothetical protein
MRKLLKHQCLVPISIVTVRHRACDATLRDLRLKPNFHTFGENSTSYHGRCGNIWRHSIRRRNREKRRMVRAMTCHLAILPPSLRLLP